MATATWFLMDFSSITYPIYVKKNRRKLDCIESFGPRKKVGKLGLTILPWQQLNLPSYHGILKTCRSQSK